MNLNQITLPSTDLERSADFYRKMGFTQIVSAPPRYARFECPQGEATFSLHQVAPADGSASQGFAGTGVVVYFEVDDLDARVAHLCADGFVFDSMPTDERWLWREARLRDPDGNTLCLFHAGRNRRFPPWRLAAEG